MVNDMLKSRLTSVLLAVAVVCTASVSLAAGSPADAVLKWQWTTNPSQPGVTDVMSMPAVGDITGDGIAEIVFVAADVSDENARVSLIALSGDSGRIHWILDDVDGYEFDVNSAPVIGDLGAGNGVEVCVQAFQDDNSGLLCLNPDGTVRQFIDIDVPGNGPSIADLDGDGVAEIMDATGAFDAAGNRLVSTDEVPQFGISFAADLNFDGILEVITERAILDLDGRTLWGSTSRYGPVGLADIDRDGYPELVQSLPDPAEIRVLNIAQGGGVLWSTELRGRPALAGPPTIADFNGDGLPEIAVATFEDVYLLDNQGVPVWQVEAHDLSSGHAGLSAFDFDGDGDYELAYADEQSFRIMDGRDGSTLFEFAEHGSGTWLEYPVIADVDNDGAAEVVLGSNNFFEDGSVSGVTVFEGTDEWAASRRYWNQHAYMFTNLNVNGTVPSQATPNWWCSATFRAQGNEIDDICEEIPRLEPEGPDVVEPVISYEGGGAADCTTIPGAASAVWALVLIGLVAIRRRG